MTTVFEVLRSVHSLNGAGRKPTASALVRLHGCSYKKAKSMLETCVEINLMSHWSEPYRANVKAHYYILTDYGHKVYDAIESARIAKSAKLPF